MIKDGFFVYGATESPLSTFQFTNPILHISLVAALTTILSYQTTAIITDVCLGFKRRASRGTARITDLAVMHFSEQASALAVATAFLNTRFLARWRYHGFLGNRGTCHAHPSDPYVRKGRLSSRAASKLLLLLLTAPLVNLVATVLSLEADKNLSFGEAGFGGVALGLRLTGDPVVNQTQKFSDCREFETKFGIGDLPAAKFLLCVQHTVLNIQIQNNVTISLKANPAGIVTVEIGNSLEVSHKLKAAGMIRAGQRVYRLRQTVTDEVTAANELVQLVSNETAYNYCSNSQSTVSGLQVRPNTLWTENGTELTVSATVPCRAFFPFDGNRVMFRMSSFMNIKEVDSLDVLEITGGRTEAEFSSGDRLPLVLRRRPYISFFSLLLSVCVVIFLRVLTRILTNNDTNAGFELIVKDALGMKSFDSMLHGHTTVEYWDGQPQGWAGEKNYDVGFRDESESGDS